MEVSPCHSVSFDPFTCVYVEVSARDGDTCDIGDSKCAKAPCPNNMICHCSDPAVSDVPINEISGDLSANCANGVYTCDVADKCTNTWQFATW